VLDRLIAFDRLWLIYIYIDVVDSYN
jgi:hypothetical protein